MAVLELPARLSPPRVEDAVPRPPRTRDVLRRLRPPLRCRGIGELPILHDRHAMLRPGILIGLQRWRALLGDTASGAHEAIEAIGVSTERDGLLDRRGATSRGASQSVFRHRPRFR